MDREELLEYSREKRESAQRLITEKKVLGILGKYGNPITVGSYELDLMYGEDIDIVVETEKPYENAVESLNEFIRAREFQKYEFGDFEKHRRSNRPEGFIVNLLGDFEGRRWEVEIWFFRDISHYREQLEKLKSLITQDKRTEILEAKLDRSKRGRDKHNLSSMEIYNKILDLR